MRQSIVVEWKNCTGCRLCEMACSMAHEESCNPRLSRIRVVRFPERGMSVPNLCAQCSTRPCREVCPVNAIGEDPKTSANWVDEDRCIGCKECVMACPFGAITIHPQTGRAMVCDMCGGNPACASVCSARALVLDTVDSAAAKKRRGQAVLQLVEASSASDEASCAGS